MNEIVLSIVSLSVSASIVAAVLFAFRPLYRNRLTKNWQYYIWLVVMLRLLLPLAPEANLMNTLFGAVTQQAAPGQAAQTDSFVREQQPNSEIGGLQQAGDELEFASPAAPGESSPAQPESAPPYSPWKQLSDSLWLLWFIPALVLLVRSVTSYNSFLRYIQAGKEEVRDEAVLTAYQRACQETGMRKPLPVYRNRLASSPMIVGVFRPCIILPELNMDMDGMQLVLRHELVHHKRRDLLYKWLVHIAVCIHWFNPLVHIMSREIGKNCELSCDERVVADMPAGEKSRYGDTLLASIQTGGTYNSAVCSVTLSEEGRHLLERLRAIVESKPGSYVTGVVAVACSIAMLGFASFTGVYIGFAAANYKGAAAVPLSANRSQVQEPISGTIEKNLERYIQDRAEAWANEWAQDWVESWTGNLYDTGAYWNEWGSRWEEQWGSSDTSQYGQDSWQNLTYRYQDGYLVGVGIKNADKVEDYDRTETVNAGGKAYTVAFAEGYESYADDARVMALVRQILVEDIGGWWGGDYYVLRSVQYNADPASLLRELYQSRAFVEFMEVVNHCGGLDVIEELMHRAVDDGESLYFMFLAQHLPGDYSGEELARRAAEQQDIIMLEAMSPYITPTLHDTLLQETLQLPAPPQYPR